MDSEDENKDRLDFLHLRSNKIPRLVQVLMYITGIAGTVLLAITFACMVYHPVNQMEYLNNIQLKKVIDLWDSQHLAVVFNSTQLKVSVGSYSNERPPQKLGFSLIDSSFELTKHSGFFAHVFSQNDYEFGVLEFEQFNVPLGNSVDYCLTLTFNDRLHKIIYHERTYKRVKNQPACEITSNSHLEPVLRKGIKITPWKEIKTACKDCVCPDGFVQRIDGSSFCLQYELLEKVCLVVAMNTDFSVEYLRGCYKNNQYMSFRRAKIHEKTSFEDLRLEVREQRDPFIVALTLSQTNQPIRFENANFPTIIQTIFKAGFASIIFPVMLNLVYKANRSPSANLKRTRITSIIYLKDK